LLPRTELALENAPAQINAQPKASQSDLEPTAFWQPPFVGRANELAQLSRLFSEAIAHKAKGIVVRGQPGFGKTRLVAEFLESVAGEARVLSARCYRSERRIGFAATIDLLGRSLTISDTEGLPDIWRQSLAEIVPTIMSEPHPLPTLGTAAARSRLFESILQLLLFYAKRQPTVVFLDDIQWADRSTAAALSYVFHRLESARILIILTLRSPTGLGRKCFRSDATYKRSSISGR
jgi:predicted ATPase